MSVKLFENEILNVSIESFISEDNEIYFKARDVAEALGYENTRDAIIRHVWEEDRLNLQSLPTNSERVGLVDALRGIHPQTIFISESGLYQLIFGSELPSARNFKRWVFSEVLPSIRRTGNYSMNPVEKVRSITLEDLSEM